MLHARRGKEKANGKNEWLGKGSVSDRGKEIGKRLGFKYLNPQGMSEKEQLVRFISDALCNIEHHAIAVEL